MFIPATLEAFLQVQATIQAYDIASRNRLNLHKFTIILFNISHTIVWLQRIGYIISDPEIMHQYMEALWGANLHPN